jgi:hypothetical protein
VKKPILTKNKSFYNNKAKTYCVLTQNFKHVCFVQVLEIKSLKLYCSDGLQAFSENIPFFSIAGLLSGILEFMGARYELGARACEVQETPWAQLSQCDTIAQPIHMAWFTAFRFDWRNVTIGFRPIEEIPREEPPRVAEPAHVDQRAPLCFVNETSVHINIRRKAREYCCGK